MMTGMELDMRWRLFAEGASRQLRPEGFAEEVDDLLRRPSRVSDVQSRMTFVITIAHFQPLFDRELEASRLAVLE